MLSLRGLVPALAAAAVLTPAASNATVVRAPDLDRLVRAAARIVVTEVVEVRVAAEAGRHVRPVPITFVTLRVNDTLKGPAALQLEIELTGGRVDEGALEIVGMPRFEVGQRDVLFLHDTPGMLSPIVGLFAGRFRVVDNTVEPAAFPAGPAATALPDFARTIRGIVAAQRVEAAGTAPPESALPLLVPRRPGLRLPAFLRVALGPSPALANGCRDWACAAGRAVEAARQRVAGGAVMPSVIAAASVEPAGTAILAWGTAVGGRVLDPLTLAVAVREESDDDGERGRTTIVLNGSRTWNAWEAGDPGDGRSTDLVAVLAEALASLAEGAPAATDDRPAGTADDGAAATRGAREPPARLSPRVAAAADACAGGSGAMRNPRLLIFDSVDHARMTAYQVGFFLPRAASPVTVVAMPLTAFLERRVVDLPDSELAAMQRTQVASITSAGLATPLGRIYTYRVRGVWSGGTTAWSAPSPPFVRCPQ